jgi:hypothetical protein
LNKNKSKAAVNEMSIEAMITPRASPPSSETDSALSTSRIKSWIPICEFEGVFFAEMQG